VGLVLGGIEGGLGLVVALCELGWVWRGRKGSVVVVEYLFMALDEKEVHGVEIKNCR
jgi:hypothetical protein